MTTARLTPYTGWPVVEGHCHGLSHVAGDTVAVSCRSSAPSFSVEVTRVGAERSTVWSQSGVSAAAHDLTGEEYATGCHWPVSVSIDTDTSWPSGFYEVSFVADTDAGLDERRARSEAFFVLRPPASGPRHHALLVLSTNTYNAYNQWGGKCLYTGAHRVSFHRPVERGFLLRPAAPFETDFDGRIANTDDPSDPGHNRLQRYQLENEYPLLTDSSGWHNWERRFVRWAESAGHEFDYAINSDLEFHPEILDGHDLLVTVGHDEYWSWGMRDTVDSFVDAGGNWAIFSGNTCFWQVRYEDDGRTMVCHKGLARRDDPVMRGGDRERLTSMWSDPVIGRPETATTGLTFTRGGYHRIGHGVPNGSGAFTLHRPHHWAFDGTGLRYGDQLGTGSFVVGYEVDGCSFTTVDGLPQPTHEDGSPDDLEILATSPARLLSITEDVCEAPRALWASTDPPGDLEGVAWVLFGDASPGNVAKVAHGHAVMGCFTRGAGTVVNVGSADWAYGLDTDPAVQKVTSNILTRLGAAAVTNSSG